MAVFQDLTGRKFGRLRVVKRVKNNKWNHSRYTCVCTCGNNVLAHGSHLISGDTKSCGCLWREWRKATIKHGHCMTTSAEYTAYANALQRCRNPKQVEYTNYGGRGILFKFKSFKQFLSVIGLKPHAKLTLDRINNNGHYEPGNVRWATWSVQNKNKRKRRSIK